MTEFSSPQKSLDRNAQLDMARADFVFANDNKIPYRVLADRINEALGTKWDKSHARRFIRNADFVRGTIFGNSLKPDQVSKLRRLSEQIKAEVEMGLGAQSAPFIERDFKEASYLIRLTLKEEEFELIETNPKLRDIMKIALQITVENVIRAYEAGFEDGVAQSTPKGPAPGG